MSSLPEGLPLEIKKALQAIDFKFDVEKQSNPFYFVSYSEVKMRGWNTAEKDLEGNLNRVLEILKQDEYIGDRDKKIQKLTKNISELDTSLGFYSPAFYLAYKLKYLRTVRGLARTARPKSYSQFRFDEVGKIRKSEPAKKTRRKINISEQESKQLYEKYLIDFERQNHNPNMESYRELYNKTNPQNLIRYYISEVHQFFNNELTMVYEKSHTEKTNDEKAHRLLRKLCYNKSRGLTNHRFTPFSYIGLPNFLKGDEQQIITFYGQQFDGKAGEGGSDYYKLENGRFTHKERIRAWFS